MQKNGKINGRRYKFRKGNYHMASSVRKNFTYQMIYEILILILPFVTSPYIARKIGAEGLGVYSYSYSIAYYFVLISMLGLKNYGNRAIARSRDNQKELNSIFSNLLALHIGISLICTLIYLIYAFTLKNERIYALIQIAYVLSGLFDISWFFFGIEKFKLTVTRNVIIKILNVSCVFIFVKDASDLWKYCVIMAVGGLISQISLWIPLRKYVSFVKPSWSIIKTHVRPMLVLFIPTIAISLYKYMDKIMLGSLASKEQLGFYENAEKVANIPMTIISSFGTVMLPKMSNLAAKSDHKAASYYMSVSMKYVMCLAFALAFGLAGVGTVFAPIFWGMEFLPSGILIMGLSITLPFISFANVIRTQYLIPHQKDKEYLSSVVSGALVNLILNWLLISQLGAMGATIGTIAAEVSVCLIQCFAVRKELPLFSYLKSTVLFLLFGGIMFSIVYYMGSVMTISVKTLISQVITGMIIYGIAVLIYLLVTKDKFAMQMLSKQKRG